MAIGCIENGDDVKLTLEITPRLPEVKISSPGLPVCSSHISCNRTGRLAPLLFMTNIFADAALFCTLKQHTSVWTVLSSLTLKSCPEVAVFIMIVVGVVVTSHIGALPLPE